MVSETRVFQASDSENLMILGCTVFDWSTHVTNRRTDKQTNERTELQWLRLTTAVSTVTRNTRNLS